MPQTKKLYDILGVPENADKSQIKKAYFKLAQKYNPNVPENKEKFQQINNAYETLKDDEKRQLYDRYGDDYIDNPEQFQQGGFFDGDPFSMFDMFTGGGRRARNQNNGPRQARPIGQQVEVTLEQMYNGAEIPLNITRQVKCQECNGIGASEPGIIGTCQKCHGQGVYMATRRMGNMIMQQQVQCDQCHGQGECCTDRNKICKKCKGQKVITETKTINVHLDPGTPDGYQQIIYGEGNYEPNAQQGDFVAEFHMKKHSTFTREEADLFMDKKISFVEALCGVSFTVKHPCGDVITIFRDQHEIVGNGQILCVRNMGMPIKGRIYEHGNLFIKFEVVAPNKITDQQKQQLINILATQQQKENIQKCSTLKHDGVKVCELVYVNPKNRTKSDAEQQGQDEYGDNQRAPQEAQCTTM